MPHDFEQLAEKLRNWGRWGLEDQRGTLNLIGPEALLRGASSVLKGTAFSLGLDFGKDGPQSGGKRFNPRLFATDLFSPLNPNKPNVMYSDDVIMMPLQAATQWDALGHVHYNGTLYGGRAASQHLSPSGTTHCGVEHLAKPGIVSRGILLDIAGLYKMPRLEPGHTISVDDLRRACGLANVHLESGDVVCIRTGHITRFTVDGDRIAFNGPQPGVSFAVAEWLHERQVAAVAADNLAVESLTADIGNQDYPLPFHCLALTEMGMPLGEMWNFEELASDCANDGRYAFLLCAPPLPIPGAFGSPVNPIALK